MFSIFMIFSGYPMHVEYSVSPFHSYNQQLPSVYGDATAHVDGAQDIAYNSRRFSRWA